MNKRESYINKLAQNLHDNKIENSQSEWVEVKDPAFYDNFLDIIEFYGEDFYSNLKIATNRRLIIDKAKTPFFNLPKEIKKELISKSEVLFDHFVYRQTSKEELKVSDEDYAFAKDCIYNNRKREEKNAAIIEDAKMRKQLRGYDLGEVELLFVLNEKVSGRIDNYFFKSWDGFVYEVCPKTFNNLLGGAKVNNYLFENRGKKVSIFKQMKLESASATFEAWKNYVDKQLDQDEEVIKTISDYSSSKLEAKIIRKQDRNLKREKINYYNYNDGKTKFTF